jgi:hypothetical protein
MPDQDQTIVAVGWPNNQRPDNADAIIDNDELMTSWAKTRLVIAVRVHADDKVRVDSDMMRQMDLIREH